MAIMMTADAYREYLLSDHWKCVRDQALERAWHRCQVCNSPDVLDVHHRTYERIGREQPEDLTVLCDRCHSLFHEQTKTVTSAVTLESALAQCYEAIDIRQQDGHPSVSGLPTGFVDLDAKTAGLHPGGLVVIAAAPGVGKTGFLLNVVRNIAMGGGHSTFLVSLEESRTQLAEHLLAAQARVDGQKIRSGNLKAGDFQSLTEAGRELRRAKIFIDDTPCQNMMHISASARKFKQEHDIRIVIIDCLDLIEPDNPREFRQEQVRTISQRLKSLAKELRIPVMASTRLTRGSEDRGDYKPRLTDLRQNWTVEHEADVVLLLHRPELHYPGQRINEVEVFIGKQRSGPTGEITLAFFKEFMRFEDYAFAATFDL
jgi:replicative DNA helicase